MFLCSSCHNRFWPGIASSLLLLWRFPFMAWSVVICLCSLMVVRWDSALLCIFYKMSHIQFFFLEFVFSGETLISRTDSEFYICIRLLYRAISRRARLQQFSISCLKLSPQSNHLSWGVCIKNDVFPNDSMMSYSVYVSFVVLAGLIRL